MEIKNYLGEIWRPVKGYEGLYEVSNYGRVRSLDKKVWNRFSFVIRKGKLLKQSPSHNGYLRIILQKDKAKRCYFVHRLVAWAFPEICGEWFEGAQVNHKNEIVTDNRAENLEWCSPFYNSNYGTAQIRKSIKTRNGINSKQVCQYSLSGEPLKTYPSLSEVERQTGFKKTLICDVCNGKYKQGYGYKWEYL